MWQIGQILTCAFVLQFNVPVYKAAGKTYKTKENITEIKCKITEVYRDPNIEHKSGDVYASVDCSEDIKNKFNIIKHSLYNNPIKLVFQSEDRCF